ncbi:hypothetical protein ACIRSD_45995, partial [Streptomyces acidicola]
MDFTAAEGWIYFVLIGERPLEASSDMAYENGAPHDTLAERLQGTRKGIMELSSMVDGALPPDSADQFRQTTSRLLEIVDQLSEQARGQTRNLTKQSNNIMTSKIELQIELAFLLAELALITALSFFTGGLSFLDTAVAKARTTVAILTILTRLMGDAPGPFSSILQALQEALTNFAAQVMTISLTRGNRRPSGIDWKDVGISAFAGFVAGIVGDVIARGITNYFKNNFKNFYDNKWGNFGTNVFTGAASEGPAEGVAELLTNGIFYGKWKVDPMAIAGGSVSSVTGSILNTVFENIAGNLGSKFFNVDDFTNLNTLPDPNSPLGGGGGSGNTTFTPNPTPTPNPIPIPTPNPITTPSPTPTTADLTPPPLPNPVPNGPTFVTPPPTPAPTPTPLPNTALDATTTPSPTPTTANLTPPPTPAPTPTPTPLPDPTADLPSNQDGVITPDPTPGISTPPNPSLDTSAPAPLPSPKTSPLPDSSSVTDYSDYTGDDASTVFDDPSSVGSVGSITTPSTPATSVPNSPSLTPQGQGTGKDGAPYGQFEGNPDLIPDDVPSDLPSLSPDALPDGTNADGQPRDTAAPGQHTPATTPASSDVPRPRTESTPAPGEQIGRETGQNDEQFTDAPQSDTVATPTGTPVTTPATAPGATPSHQDGTQDATRDVTQDAPQDVRETGQDALATTGEHTPAPQPALAHPTPDPVRPEQWRHRQEDAPATQLSTELPGSTPEADGTVVRTEVQRIEAEDGRWVRNLTLDLPVNFGEGFTASQLPELQNRMRGLLATQVNTGFQLPRSGDQLNIDLNLVHKPDHPEAIELSTTPAAMPTESNQFDIRLSSDDPSLSNSERTRRQAQNNATALRQVLRYAGVDVDPATLPPGPAVPLEYLQTVEDLTDSGPVVADHALSAPPVAVATTSSPGPVTPATPEPATQPATEPAPLTASAFPTAADWNAPAASPARKRQAAETARTHLAAAHANPSTRRFMQSVVGGTFTGKRGDGGRVTVKGQSLDELLGRVDEFYDHADVLRDAEQRDGGREENLTLYRAIGMDAGSRERGEFIDRLPSSASHDLGFVQEWTGNRGGPENYAILEINVPPDHRAMALSYPPGYERAPGDPTEINETQSEVTLAPSRLTVTGTRVENGLTIISVDAAEIPRSEVEGLVRDQSSDLGPADAFTLFGQFFRQDSLRAAYPYDLGDATVTEGAGPNGSRTFTVTRPKSTASLTITVARDGDTVNVVMEPSDGERWQLSYGSPTDFNQIGSYLRGRQLHQSPQFETLPYPDAWYDITPPPSPIQRPSSSGQWNSPVSRSDTDWGKGAVRRRDLGDQGRSHGVAYFSDPDWKPRERSYEQLSELTHMVVWSEDGQGRPTGEVLPVPGGRPRERFFFARHGRAGGLSEAEGRDLAARAAASGYQDVYLLPCYTPGVAGARPDVDLSEWAREHGKTVHEVLGRSAVTESSDARFGPVLWHVQLSDTDGGGPVLRSHHPDGTVTETWGGTGAHAQGITRPADNLWDASVGVTASPKTVNDLKGLWDRAVEQEGGQRLTVTVDGGKVTAGDLMTAVLAQIGATDRAAEITLPKPKASLAAGSTHKVLLSFNADGQRGTVSREIRVESRSVSGSTPQPSAPQRPPFDPETTPAENERKLDVGREFSAVVNGLIRNDPQMRDIRHPLVLSGAGQINLTFDSPRPMADLDFRLTTPYVVQYEDLINRALAERFPSAPGAPPNVLQRDSHDPRALSGRINGVEVTIGPSSHAYEGTSVVEGIVVPSTIDSVVDKAYALAARAGGKKRDTDLFDLLWALGEHPGLETALAEELVKRRGEAYAARLPAGGKQDITAQFGHVLGGMMGTKRARESLMAQWPQFGATPEDVQRLQRTLTDLADVFRAGSGPFRSLVVTAGNFTGDNFGLATALLLNPKLHVGVMTGPRHPDQVGPFLRKTITAPVHAQYAKAVARLDANTDLSPGRRADALARLTAQRDAELRAQEARVHTLYSNDPHGLYTQAANGYTALPYAEMSPPVPQGLHSTRLQKPTWYATNEVANQWGRQGHERAKVRTAWGLDTPDTRRVREFLEARGVPEKGPHVVLWSRLSSRQEGEPHPQHDTSTTGLRQIIDQLPPGTNVIIAGDSSNNGALEELADEYPNVHDLTEFWTGDDWQQAFPGGTREDQFQVFDHLSQVSDGGLKHLGFRSGNLEAYALIGHQVRYLEETGNRQGKRMKPWHTPDIGYQRITLNKVPTLAGQWVVANAAVTGKENPVPWWSERDGTRDRDRLKTKALAKFDIANTPAQRGFDPLDLQAIGSYLGFSGPATFSPAFPTSGQWNSPASWSRSSSDWGKDVVRRRDLASEGRSHGVAYFSDPDWKPRERSYEKLPELTHMVVWSEDGQGRPTGEVLPVPGGKPGERFFFARHGRPGGLSEAEGRDLAARAAASGYQDVYLLPCHTPGVAGARPEVDLDQWARDHGKTVHEVLGRSAVTESSDARFGPVLWHVQLSDTDGGPVLRSHHPDGTVTETWGGGGARAQGITRPADNLWDASVGVTASPKTVNDLKGLWDRAVEQQGGQRLTVTVDGGKVTAGDLMTAVLAQIGATDRAAEITLPKPKASLAAGSTHKVLLSFNADGQRGTVSREIRVESRNVADSAPQPSGSQRPPFDPETTPAENERKLDVGREFSAVVNG